MGEYFDRKLRNRFWMLRHGRSEANQNGLIASSLDSAVSRFGLTKTGRDQVLLSLNQHRAEIADVKQIFRSDFRRARETAEIAAGLLKIPVEEKIPLRERGFGQWEGQSDENYQIVWLADAEDPTHEQWGVESVDAVAHRMSEIIKTIDQSCLNQAYLIVSHGDPLQVLKSAVRGHDVRLHRQLDPMQTAELRPLF